MKDRSAKDRRREVVATILVIVIVAMAILVGTVAIRCARIFSEPIDLSLFDSDRGSSYTKIYVMREGEWCEWQEERIVGERIYEHTPLSETPQMLIDAFVAIEDKRFFTHDGVDWYRTAGAAFNYILHFDQSFGASTITQQVIKNVTGRDEVTLSRKLREISWALQLERERPKEEILELYLNIINLSDGCYGIGSAARRYFSKSPSELTLLECAALAAITNSPSYYNPIRHPENNAERRDTILCEMYAQGRY